MFNMQVYADGFDQYVSEIYETFGGYFQSREELEVFVKAIDEEGRKLFLHLASMYHYLINKSELMTDNHCVDYFNNSYKLLTIVSLIESTMGEKYEDFFTWLSRRRNKNLFPIKREAMPRLYEEYKETHGSQRKFFSFFKELDNNTKKRLEEKVRDGNDWYPLTRLSKYLYELRSEFVHSAIPVLTISEHPVLSKLGDKIHVSELSLDLLKQVFEHGLLIRFGYSREKLNSLSRNLS